MFRQRFLGILILVVVLLLPQVGRGEPSQPNDKPRLDAAPYLDAVQKFADTVLQHGRDTHGPLETPLFVDGLHAERLEPATWQCRGETWVLSNFASQQPLMRLLDGLTAVTGQPKYARAAEATATHALEHVRSPNGLLYWGGHMAWDLEQDKPVGQSSDSHELKGQQAYYLLMHRVNPQATRKLMETVWASHVLDWSRLDYNRHGSLKKPCLPEWDHAFDEEIDVPFPAVGGNLAFCNVTPPLMHAGTMLAVLDDDDHALTWTRRLARRWQQGRDPDTGLCGGQLSYREHDRAQDALGHVHPDINEAQIVASYHQISRYHYLPLVQMQAAETLLDAGGRRAELGRQLLDWASDDLDVYRTQSHDPKTGNFLAMMIDGTPLRWQEAKTDYYVPESFAPRPPEPAIFWAYAMAYRMTGKSEHGKMLCTLGRQLGLGDLEPMIEGANTPSASSDASDANDTIDASDWRLIYGLLEIHGKTDNRASIQLACRVADNLLTAQAPSGLFPRPSRQYARTGDEVPLALLHLAATLDGKRHLLPPAVFDRQFFHCEYHGELEEHQKKRADKRTYDISVYYGS